MKSVIVSSVCMSAVLFVLAIQSEINGKTSNVQELEESLAISVSQTMREVMEQESYGIENRNEFIAAFLQAMVMRTNSDVDMTISILSADMENGLMDVEVKEHLVTENVPLGGDDGQEISVRRTVIFERKS